MNLKEIIKQFVQDLSKVESEKDLNNLEIQYLGRKGKLTKVLRGLSELSLVEKKRQGFAANDTKEEMIEKISIKKEELRAKKWEVIAKSEKLDINSDRDIEDRLKEGHLHLLSNFIFKIQRVFEEMGYEVVDGYEIETDWYNFGALNVPEDHPAKDDHDTFYVKDLGKKKQRDGKDQLLLRTQTSAMQVRYMESHKPPIKIIVPGKCYRRDDDVSHFPMFHQFEGLVVGENLTLADLKGTLATAVKKLLGPEMKIRFRSNFFPFTEPSIEVDVTCTICKGKGCNICKKTGWLELLGAGMIHPNVLKNGGIDPEKYTGFAFGAGIERLAMMKHEIPNIKYIYENDIRFLEQF